MLEVIGLTVRFGATTAVDRVDIRVHRGEVLAVLGPSGCGKSTLLRAVAGLEEAAGVVAWDGRDVTGVPPHRRGFALMFQDGQLFPQRSVADNVAYPLRLRRLPRADAVRRVAELLDLVGLPGFGDRRTTTLSGGERQRVALARSLAADPRLLLLDEPLSALDRSMRERLAGDLRRILRAAGTTAIMVTHDQEEAFAVADRMALMRRGQVVQQGSLDEVWSSPVDAEAASFLGYPTVLGGDAAARLLALANQPVARGIALRRSALLVDPHGPLEATVRTAQAGADLLRLTVDLPGVGEVHAVAELGDDVAPGHRVRLALDPRRIAPVGDTDA